VSANASRINDLTHQVAHVAAGPQGPAGSVGATGPAGPSSGAGFWPVTDLVVTPSFQPIGGVADYGLTVSLDSSATIPGTGPLQVATPEAVMKVTCLGQTYWKTDTFVTFGNTNTSPPGLPAGTPVYVEYWVKYYGMTKHGTATFSGWAYDN